MRYLPVSTHPHGSGIRSTHPTFLNVGSGDGRQVLTLAQKALYQQTIDPTEPRRLAPAETKGWPWGQLPFSREGTRTESDLQARQLSPAVQLGMCSASNNSNMAREDGEGFEPLLYQLWLCLPEDEQTRGR